MLNPFILLPIVYHRKFKDNRDDIVKTLIFIFFFCLSFLIIPAFAQTTLPAFMTPLDLLRSNSSSNISLKNNGNLAATVYGLYINQFSSILPGQTCDQASIMYATTQNITAGAMVTPTVVPIGKSATVGSNFLYNMIYSANYYIGILYPSSPPGCALPGCTWGSDTTIYQWCIYLGALAPVTTSTGYTSNVPPATEAASSSGLYNYNLISNYIYLGPISCNDQTLTCTAASPQTQLFS